MSKFDELYYSVIEEGKRRNKETFAEILARTKQETPESSGFDIFNLANNQEEQTYMFEADYAELDELHKKWVDEWFHAWRNGTSHARFEFKGPAIARSVVSAVAALGEHKDKPPLYAVTVSEREPAIRMFVTKVGNKIIWIRLLTSYDEYQKKLSDYKYDRKA